MNTLASKSRNVNPEILRGWSVPLCGAFIFWPQALAFFGFALYLTPLIAPGQTSDEAFTKATAAVDAATPRA